MPVLRGDAGAAGSVGARAAVAAGEQRAVRSTFDAVGSVRGSRRRARPDVPATHLADSVDAPIRWRRVDSESTSPGVKVITPPYAQGKPVTSAFVGLVVAVDEGV